jgi:SAM-dependent methyltransferase
MDQDWTKKLFIEHGDLFQVFLEERLVKAEDEARGLAGLFEAHGVGPEATILDLNCGIGRHAVPLAKLGYRTVGVDISPRYIARAQALAAEHGVAGRTEFLVLDGREVGKGLAARRFDAVINMFTSLGYYDEATDAVILRQCRKLTNPGGLFVLDTSFRDWVVRHFQPSGIARVRDLLVVEERKLNLETSRMVNVWTFFRKTDQGYTFEAEIPLDHRMYGLHELIALFERSGWRYRAAYRDFELREPSLDGSRLIVVAENPGHGSHPEHAVEHVGNPPARVPTYKAFPSVSSPSAEEGSA